MVFLPLSQIKFTQDSIAMCFQNGNTVRDTCEQLALGNFVVNDFPKMRVFLNFNQYYSLDNRRLYVFRVMEKLGILKKIEVKLTDSIPTEKITTQNGGCHVTVRNRKDNNERWIRAETYQHCCDFLCRQQFTKQCIPEWWNSSQKCHVSCNSFEASNFPALSDLELYNPYQPSWRQETRSKTQSNSEINPPKQIRENFIARSSSQFTSSRRNQRLIPRGEEKGLFSLLGEGILQVCRGMLNWFFR